MSCEGEVGWIKDGSTNTVRVSNCSDNVLLHIESRNKEDRQEDSIGNMK